MLLASCRDPLPAAAPVRHVTPPPVVAEFRVKEALLAGGKVSVHVEMPLTASGPRPTVIALIGDPHRYLGAGFVAVRYSINWSLINGPPPSPPPADQAAGKWVLASPSADVLGEGYLRQIATTANDYVPIVIDWLATLPEVDAARIGMAGISTNGFVTLQAVAADRRIRAAVAISACGDYHDFLQYSSMGLGGAPLALAPAYDEWLQRQEIVKHPRDLVHAALLMVNKVGDELIPISCGDATASALERAYRRAGASDRFRYVRLPVAGHGMGPDENSETFAWLQQWLQGQ